MATLPKPASPTVDAIYRACESAAETESRPHLGASVIGRECARELWYLFRWASAPRHSGRILRLFRRGQREEPEFVEDLRRIGCTVHDTDPSTGEQFRFADLGGHFGGSMDGCAEGIPEAPKTWHVLEFKTHGAKSFADLEKRGVASAKPEHLAQMQIYMHWAKLDRALYLAVNKDTDALYAERVQADKDQAAALIEKARRIIAAQEPPARISERPDWYQCQWCDQRAICKEGAIPAVSCRTCAHATPELDGDARWSCAHFGVDIDLDTQRSGHECPQHVFIPALLPWPAVAADETAGWVEYQKPGGTCVVNGPGGYASRELAANAEICGDAPVNRAKQLMGAEVAG